MFANLKLLHLFVYYVFVCWGVATVWVWKSLVFSSRWDLGSKHRLVTVISYLSSLKTGVFIHLSIYWLHGSFGVWFWSSLWIFYIDPLSYVQLEKILFHFIICLLTIFCFVLFAIPEPFRSMHSHLLAFEATFWDIWVLFRNSFLILGVGSWSAY